MLLDNEEIIFPITFICIIGLRSITYSFRSIHSSKKYLLTRIYEQKLEFMRAFTIIRDLRRIECGKILKLFVKQLFSRNVSREKEKNFHGFEGIHLGTKTRATPYSHRSWKTFSGSVSTLGFLATFRATIDQPQRNKKSCSMAIMLTDHLLITRIPLFRRMTIMHHLFGTKNFLI